ncbi:MAG: hypothetical protein II869_01155 [Synergistaceae bacterium]|nr:hypothetical protein [Synergistaceae bacterium]
MAQETGRTRFHYGFYAAMKVEYDIIHADVTYEQEIQLGEEPIRLDFLIIKKDAHIVLNDPIGEFFGTVNIFEYKSPEDGLSIDDFYKAMGYSFIYKGYNRQVNELPIGDMTLNLVRHSYPRELMKALKHEGFVINERYPGIYRVNGKTEHLKVQIVVSSRLPQGEYEGLHLLSKGCTKEDVFRYVEKVRDSWNENVKTNVETVINICLDINKNLSTQIEEDEAMHKTLRDILKSDFEAVRQEGRKEGLNNANERVAKDMLRKNLPLSLIEEISKLSEDTIRNLASTLGIAVM